MLVALLLQATTADAATFDRGIWGRFGRGVALRHTVEEVAVARDGWDAARRIQHFRFRLTTRDGDGTATTHWSDTRTCPAARTAAARFGSLPMPRPDPPAMIPGDIAIVMDGIGYSVTVPVGYGNGSIADPVTVRSNVGTSLAAWVEASFATLRPCWPGAPRF